MGRNKAVEYEGNYQPFLFFFFFLTNFIDLQNIVDLQCYVNFCYAANSLSYMYIFTFFPYSYPLWFIIGY